MSRLPASGSSGESIPIPVVGNSTEVPVVMVQRNVPNVVSWYGSIETCPKLGDGQHLVQDIVVALLDKGTRQKDRFEIAKDLEDRGAEIGFGSSGTCVQFAGKALSRDVAHVLRLTAEQLSQPLLDPLEFDKTVERVRASVRRSASNTSYRSSVALRQRLFGSSHPNYSSDPDSDLEELSNVTVDACEQFHVAKFGRSNLVVCAAGDFDSKEFEAMALDAFGEWAPALEPPALGDADVLDGEGERVEVNIPDRDNLDVKIGHVVPLRRDHDDFLPLYVANYILGGNFSARLMAKVRNEMGLTYGIGSSLTGFDPAYDGLWQISVTLSKDRLEEGILATQDVVRQFVTSGITQSELQAKQTTICGSYEVGLATTAGLAQTMHSNWRNGFKVDYLRTFPDAIRSLTVDQVNDAIRKYFRYESLQLVVAGTLPT